MTKSILFIMVSSLILFSCNRDLTSNPTKKMSQLFEEEVGIMNNGVFEFTVTQESIFEAALKSIPRLSDNKVKLYNVTFEENDGNKYLSIVGNTSVDEEVYEYTSKIRLDIDSKIKDIIVVRTAGISCTSNSCASCCGCLAQFQYCSACTTGTEDCTRTSSNGNSN